MKCPYCAREMEVGYLYNDNQPVQWIPHDSRPSLRAYARAKHGVPLLNHFSFFRRGGGYTAEAYYCPVCRIMIAPTQQ